MADGIIPADPGMNAGDNRQPMPDISNIPELQEEQSQADIGDPVADALKTLAEFAAVQQEKGNTGIMEALQAFMSAVMGGAPAPEEAPPEDEMAFDPFQAPEDEMKEAPNKKNLNTDKVQVM